VAETKGIAWERWLSVGGSIVAPATAISTLLFYFGYVSTRAQYLYFGLDVDTIGLSTQGFIMRSPQPLLVPLLALTLLAAGGIVLSRRLRPQLVAHSLRGAIVGVATVAVGFVLLFSYPLIGQWTYYALLTPVVLAVGGAVSAYALGLRHGAVPARVALWLTVATAVFWANATVAQWSGTGLAQEQAMRLDQLPRVIVDSRERLYLRTADVTETALPSEDGQEFRYRYRGLRLLIQNGDKMFLVPCSEQGPDCPWRGSNPTLLVELGDATRVQFLSP
jgi:hypothetical protein